MVDPLDMFGPASLLPSPHSPVAAVKHLPSLSVLPSLVDAATREVRLHMYRVPEHLSGELDLELRRGNCRTQRSKHPWINLEDRLWRLLPHEVWTDDPERATFFVVPHAFLGHRCAGVQSLEQRYLWRGLSPFLEYLYYAQPFFNRSHGRDHVTTWILENGVQCDCSLRSNLANESLAVDILKSVAKVGYWGHHDAAMFGWHDSLYCATEA